MSECDFEFHTSSIQVHSLQIWCIKTEVLSAGCLSLFLTKCDQQNVFVTTVIFNIAQSVVERVQPSKAEFKQNCSQTNAWFPLLTVTFCTLQQYIDIKWIVNIWVCSNKELQYKVIAEIVNSCDMFVLLALYTLQNLSHAISSIFRVIKFNLLPTHIIELSLVTHQMFKITPGSTILLK